MPDEVKIIGQVENIDNKKNFKPCRFRINDGSNLEWYSAFDPIAKQLIQQPMEAPLYIKWEWRSFEYTDSETGEKKTGQSRTLTGFKSAPEGTGLQSPSGEEATAQPQAQPQGQGQGISEGEKIARAVALKAIVDAGDVFIKGDASYRHINSLMDNLTDMLLGRWSESPPAIPPTPEEELFPAAEADQVGEVVEGIIEEVQE